MIKSYFKGKKGLTFWLNILAMVVILIGIPVGGFFALDAFTHHGEKIEVPDVKGMSMYQAIDMLDAAGFQVVISDSIECKDVKPGCVHEQTPKPGSEVKSGRIIYLITRFEGEPLIEMPALVGKHSVREAKQILKNLGFRLTPDEIVEGQPDGYLVGVYQRGRMVLAGDKISKERPLTLHVGGGEIDTLVVDTFFEAEPVVEEEDFDF